MSEQSKAYNDSFQQKIIEVIEESISNPETDENTSQNMVWTKENKAILSDMIVQGVALEIVRCILDFKKNMRIALNCSDSREKEYALEMAEAAEYRLQKALLLYLENMKERLYRGEIDF